jgi:hypothetical protein
MCRSKIRKEWRLSAHTNGNGLSIKKQNITGLPKGPRAISRLRIFSFRFDRVLKISVAKVETVAWSPLSYDITYSCGHCTGRCVLTKGALDELVSETFYREQTKPDRTWQAF